MGSGGCDGTRDPPAPLGLGTAGVPSFGGVPQNVCSRMMWGSWVLKQHGNANFPPRSPCSWGAAWPCHGHGWMDRRTDGWMDGQRTTIPGRERSAGGMPGLVVPGPAVGSPLSPVAGAGDPEGMYRLGEEPAPSPTLLLNTLKEQWLRPSELPSGAVQARPWAF